MAEDETRVEAKSVGIRGLRGQMYSYMVVFVFRRVEELSDTCKEFSRVKWRRRRRPTAGGGGGNLVRKKVKKLQRLIPGGKGLQADRLFLRTADYIMHLRLQVDVLQALSKIYQSSM
ncbi:hypothetical protein PTKIN_Ptkin17bG0078000 [Pterospermum kingtungense]